MSFIPSNYKIPESNSKYMKFKQGDNEFRVLDSAIVGFEYWNAEGKPVRLREQPTTHPSDMRDGEKIKAFWAFPIWDYVTKEVKVLEITQKRIMHAIKKLVDSPKWGDPKNYDLNIIREGEGLDTEYTVQSNPPSDLPMDAANAYAEQDVYMEALFDSGDPFEGRPGNEQPYNEEEIDANDIQVWATHHQVAEVLDSQGYWP